VCVCVGGGGGGGSMSLAKISARSNLWLSELSIMWESGTIFPWSIMRAW
jgi:hypothetical protein